MPLYAQVAAHWRDRIVAGGLSPGDRLPPMHELCRLHGVSHITIKQAMDRLASEGLVESAHGKGLFVSRPKLRQDLLTLTSFSEDMRARGFTPGARLIKRRAVPAGQDAGSRLGLDPADEVIEIERVRLADGEPLAIETMRVPRSLCPGLLEEDLEDASVYSLLEGKFGLRLKRAEQVLESVAATRDQARLLGLKTGAPVLLMERVAELADGRKVEYTTSVYRGDKYRFAVMMERRKAPWV